jgi:SAM-dependent methyltransferase
MQNPLAKLTDPHQFDLVPTGPGEILDVGCGSAKTPGAIGLDVSPNTAADIVHDLDVFPYPIEDRSFDQILLQDVIEHVKEPIRVFDELHRVARPGGRIQLRTPHGLLANRFIEPFEKYLAFRFPTMNIRAEFEVLA